MNQLFQHHKQPQLTLVGAGPGDPELITVKGVKALQSADIVLYDALVSEGILAYIPLGTPALFVGKRSGQHAFEQDEINALCVECAHMYGHAVRLKGGDPFVFGRGMEEVEHASKNGVDVNVIPGITSAIAVPASMNIPVTARGVSESFWVVTGSTRQNKLSSDLRLAAQSTATVVVLMGVNKLSEIVEVFKSEGKASTPVAVIQNGTLPTERSAIADIGTIEKKVEEEGLGAPAIIVIGDVVKCASVKQLSSKALSSMPFCQ